MQKYLLELSKYNGRLQFVAEETWKAKGWANCCWSSGNWNWVCVQCPPLCTDRHELDTYEPVHKVCCWSSFGISALIYCFMIIFFSHWETKRGQFLFLPFSGCFRLSEEVQRGKSLWLDGIYIFAVSADDNFLIELHIVEY